MDAKFSPQVKDILSFSHEEAVRLGNSYIGLEHLFLGIVREGDSKALQILKYLGVDIQAFRKKIETAIRGEEVNSAPNGNIPLMKQTEKALKFTYIAAKELRSDIIHPEHLLMAILRDKNNIVSQRLDEQGG